MPLQDLPPEERVLIARLGAYSAHAKHGTATMTEAARKAGPASLEYWYDNVDPNRELSNAERDKRAASAKKAHFTSLALKSAQARRARKTGRA